MWRRVGRDSAAAARGRMKAARGDARLHIPAAERDGERWLCDVAFFFLSFLVSRRISLQKTTQKTHRRRYTNVSSHHPPRLTLVSGAASGEDDIHG